MNQRILSYHYLPRKYRRRVKVAESCVLKLNFGVKESSEFCLLCEKGSCKVFRTSLNLIKGLREDIQHRYCTLSNS